MAIDQDFDPPDLLVAKKSDISEVAKVRLQALVKVIAGRHVQSLNSLGGCKDRGIEEAEAIQLDAVQACENCPPLLAHHNTVQRGITPRLSATTRASVDL